MSEFTKSGMGDGKSTGLKTSSMPGGKVLEAFPQDNVHGVNLPDTRGGSMGGSTTNLSHSLRGSSAVQK